MKSRNRIIISAVFTISMTCVACGHKSNQVSDSRILVFYKTEKFYHKAIPAGIAALEKLGSENNIDVEASKNAGSFTTENLKQYKAVVFLSTTGDVLNEEQQAAFEQYIQKGGGFVGIHAAADTEYDWPWYNQLVGAYFMSHPKPQEASVIVVDKDHPATQHLPTNWVRTDEWYNYKSIVPGLHILCKLDESSYQGGENGEDHPIAWYREFDGGRTFYTGGGHTAEAFEEPLFLEHLLGGIRYAMGVQ
jgi:type 1 glutamine amidotransferase